MATSHLGITNHARQRALERTATLLSDHEIRAAYRDGVSVGIDGAGTARLHPPTGAILVRKQNAIVTVLLAERAEELRDDHLKRCPACELRYQPPDTACPWCEASLETDSETDSQ